MFLKLLLAFTVVPFIELFLLIEVGSVIGAFHTVMLVLLTGVVGASLAREQGIKVLMEINLAMSQGRMPGNELVQGAMVLVGGVMLLTPGFVTDILGLTLLFPLTRRFYAYSLERYFKRKLVDGTWTVEYTGPRFM